MRTGPCLERDGARAEAAKSGTDLVSKDVAINDLVPALYPLRHFFASPVPYNGGR
jgi:hypothetical protein